MLFLVFSYHSTQQKFVPVIELVSLHDQAEHHTEAISLDFRNKNGKLKIFIVIK